MRTALLCMLSALLFSARSLCQEGYAEYHGPSSLLQYRLTKISRSYDFVIRVHAHSPENLDGYREGPGEVRIFKKGEQKPFQTIPMKNFFFALADNGKPPINTAPLYGDQGLINVGDFNFDGQEDFAIQTGSSGSYGGPSYSVYLFMPSSGRFQLSKPMSDLIESTLGFFNVDSRHKRLVTISKDGCCYHETTEYAVRNNRPIPVERVVEDGGAEANFIHVSYQRMVNGQWHSTKQERVPLPPDEPAK